MNVIFIDVDGTLVNYNNELPNFARNAIYLARARGHTIVIVTGRSKAEMYPEILALNYDGYIGGNGNYIEYNNEIIMHRTLTLAETTQIVNWLTDNHLAFYLEANSGLYASHNFSDQAESVIKAYGSYKNADNADELTVQDVFPNMIYGADYYRDDINKVSFILNDYSDYLKAKKVFKEFEVNTWGGQGEKALFGDIALANINKQTAIRLLLEHIGIDREYTYAVGDAMIDIPMLDYCQVGIAMGNGGESIKAMADFVTTDVNDDGLYKAFKYFKLI